MLRTRAEAAGLDPITIADILGMARTSVYRSLDDDRPQARAVIAAWEIMSTEQRGAWLAELGVATDRRGRGRPRKG